MMETADLSGISMKSVMGPINYRPLKLLGSLGLIVEPPKHRTFIARIRLATLAQLRVVDSRDNGSRGSGVINAPKFSGVLSGSGR